MIDKISRLAQQTADGLSRRNMLQRVGRGALPALAAMGALLGGGKKAHAQFRVRCCYYHCHQKIEIGGKVIFEREWDPKDCVPYRVSCGSKQIPFGNCNLTGQSTASVCSQC